MVGAYASGPGGQLTFSVEDSPRNLHERANRHHIRLARCEWPSVSRRDRDLLWLQQWVHLW